MKINLKKIKSGNYKNLFVKESSLASINEVDLKDPVIINNITIINNTGSTQNDEWLTTEF